MLFRPKSLFRVPLARFSITVASLNPASHNTMSHNFGIIYEDAVPVGEFKVLKTDASELSNKYLSPILNTIENHIKAKYPQTCFSAN